jgi:hypothetical protein
VFFYNLNSFCQLINWIGLVINRAHEFLRCLCFNYNFLWIIIVYLLHIELDLEQIFNEICLRALFIDVVCEWLNALHNILEAFIRILLLESSGVLLTLSELRIHTHKALDEIHRLNSLALAFEIFE